MSPSPPSSFPPSLKVPLLFEPGERWRYSYSYDVLGVVLMKVRREGGREGGHDREYVL